MQELKVSIEALPRGLIVKLEGLVAQRLGLGAWRLGLRLLGPAQQLGGLAMGTETMSQVREEWH